MLSTFTVNTYSRAKVLLYVFSIPRLSIKCRKSTKVVSKPSGGDIMLVLVTPAFSWHMFGERALAQA